MMLRTVSRSRALLKTIAPTCRTVLTQRAFSTKTLFRVEAQTETPVKSAPITPPPTTEKSDDKPKRRATRITSNNLPYHTAKEMASYPRVTFTYSGIKQSHHKVNETCKIIRRLNCREAIEQLSLLPSKAARILAKWIKSCLKTAENTKGLNTDRLLVNQCWVGRGPYAKRIRYMGHGKTGVMRRKMTNVSIELVEVPMKEGERRLGIRGWKNSTWQRYDETMARLREIIEELYQEKGRKITAREIYEQYVKEGWHLRKRNQAKLTQEKKE